MATVALPPASLARPFLRAEWRNLVLLNYEVDPELLEPLAPAGTELDLYEGSTFVSLVGFMFLNTRVMGLPIPWHRNFEEVNLRFYVRRQAGDEWRRGVVFIREIVPRRAIALVARRRYNEPYVALPMSHSYEPPGSGFETMTSAEYGWTYARGTNVMRAVTEGEARDIAEGSLEEFITEHYWGYTAQPDGSTLEYGVEHSRWRYRPCRSGGFEGNTRALYGQDFAEVVSARPASIFLAEGSEIVVRQGVRVA